MNTAQTHSPRVWEVVEVGPDSSDAREEAVVDGVPVNQTHKNLICSLIYTTLLTTFLIHSHSHSFLQLHNPGKQNNSTTLANRTTPQPWQTEQFHNPGKQNNSTTLANRTTPQPWQTEQIHNPGKQNNSTTLANRTIPQPWQTEQLHNPGKQNNSTTLANRTTLQPWQTEQFHNPGKQNNSTTLANRTTISFLQVQLHNPGKQNNYSQLHWIHNMMMKSKHSLGMTFSKWENTTVVNYTLLWHSKQAMVTKTSNKSKAWKRLIITINPFKDHPYAW